MPLLASARDQLSSLRAPPAATAELSGPEHSAACRGLEQTVLAYLKEGWHIEGARCFVLQPDTTWNSMEKFVDNELRPNGAKRQTFPAHRPGYDLIAVWKIGTLKPAYLATAMTAEPVEGKPLAGYFALKRD